MEKCYDNSSDIIMMFMDNEPDLFINHCEMVKKIKKETEMEEKAKAVLDMMDKDRKIANKMVMILLGQIIAKTTKTDEEWCEQMNHTLDKIINTDFEKDFI